MTLELTQATVLEYNDSRDPTGSGWYSWGPLSTAINADGSVFTCCRQISNDGNAGRVGMWLTDPSGALVKTLTYAAPEWAIDDYSDANGGQYPHAMSLEDNTVQVLAPFWAAEGDSPNITIRFNYSKSLLVDCTGGDIKIVAEYPDTNNDAWSAFAPSWDSQHYYFRELGIAVATCEWNRDQFFAYRKGRPLGVSTVGQGVDGGIWGMSFYQNPADPTKFATWDWRSYPDDPGPDTPSGVDISVFDPNQVSGYTPVAIRPVEYQIDTDTGAITEVAGSDISAFRTVPWYDRIGQLYYISSPYDTVPAMFLVESGKMASDPSTGMIRWRLYDALGGTVLWEYLVPQTPTSEWGLVAKTTIDSGNLSIYTDQNTPGVGMFFNDAYITSDDGVYTWLEKVLFVIDTTDDANPTVEWIQMKYPTPNVADPSSVPDPDNNTWGLETLSVGSQSVYHRDGRIVCGCNYIDERTNGAEVWTAVYLLDGGAKYPFAVYDGTEYLKAGDGIAPGGQLNLKASGEFSHSVCSSDDPDAIMWPLKILTDKGWKVVAMMTDGSLTP